MFDLEILNRARRAAPGGRGPCRRRPSPAIDAAEVETGSPRLEDEEVDDEVGDEEDEAVIEAEDDAEEDESLIEDASELGEDEDMSDVIEGGIDEEPR